MGIRTERSVWPICSRGVFFPEFPVRAGLPGSQSRRVTGAESASSLDRPGCDVDNSVRNPESVRAELRPELDST